MTNEGEMRKIIYRHKGEMMGKMIDHLKAAQIAAKEFGASNIYINLGYSESIGVQFYEEDFPFDKEGAKRKFAYDKRDRLYTNVLGVEMFCYVDNKEETNDVDLQEAASDTDGAESPEESI